MAKKPTTKKTSNTQQSSRDRLIIMILSVILGAGLGFGIAQASSTSDTDDSTRSNSTESSTAHSHDSTYEVSVEEAPKLEFVVNEDKKSGYNVKLITTDFTFTPEKVNGENILGEGHAHLYVDGVKVARLYSPYFHWDESFEGTKEFKVTLNANDHSEYAVDGEPITATQQISHDSDATGHDETHMTDSKDSHSEDDDSHDDEDNSHDDNDSDDHTHDM